MAGVVRSRTATLPDGPATRYGTAIGRPAGKWLGHATLERPGSKRREGGQVNEADAVETIQREMTVFARRARAAAGRMHPELSDS